MVHSLICNEKLDISVAIFEIIYEVLKIWKFGDLKYVAIINVRKHANIVERIGISRITVLKKLVDQAYEEIEIRGNHPRTIRNVENNLCGEIFWYFANIFYDEQVPYKDRDGSMHIIKKELEAARKYCEFCEILK